jgi:PAS domain S-box-containing protein
LPTWGIKRRVFFVALVPGVALALSLAFYFLLLRYEDVEAALVSRGAALARQLAPAAEYGAFAGNIPELTRLVQATAREPDVSAIAIFDPRGKVLASFGEKHFTGNPATLPENWSGRSRDGGQLFFNARIVRGGLDFDDPFQTNTQAPQLLGSVMLEMSRANVVARKEEIFAVTLAITMLLIAAAALLAYRLGRDITEPVLALEAVVGKIQRGQLDARVDTHKAGTLSILETGINAMAEELEAAMRRSREALASSETELRRQNQFARTLLEAQSDAGVGTLLIEQGRIVYANDSSSAIFAYTPEELYALASYVELIHPSARDQEWRDYQRRIGGEALHARYALPIVTRDGEERIVEFSIATLPGTDARRMLCVVIDITARKRDEVRLAAAYEELSVKKDDAERANLAKSRFLAAASHDLRQPLHALQLFSTELENTVTGPTQQHLTRQIGSAASAMSDLLEALLDISRLDMAGFKVRRQHFALAPLLRRVINAHSANAAVKGLQLRCGRTNAWVDSDPHLLERILNNLVANAICYTERGSVNIELRELGEIGDMVQIVIRDTGIGIAEEHLPNIFQEFYQVANAERDVGKGLGLGLAIVDRLAKSLQHDVGIVSRPGYGTTVTLTVPHAAGEEATSGGTEPDWAEDFAAHILLISEGDPVSDNLAALLRSWGCRVSEAQDMATITAALHGGDLPGAVICDDRCYTAACEALSSLPTPPPLLLLGDQPAAGSNRIAGRLAKPVRPARLRALLRHLLDEQEPDDDEFAEPKTETLTP